MLKKDACKVLVSGLLNIEVSLKVDKFPIEYNPINYPFFGIHSIVSGVGVNVGKAMTTLGDSVSLVSFLGKDQEADTIRKYLNDEGLGTQYIKSDLKETPQSIVIYDNEGKREIYCDLKDIQDKQIDNEFANELGLESYDLAVICNINFNRNLLKACKEKGILIATDVHVLQDIHDEYNKDFMEYADILFLSDEIVPCMPEKFIKQLVRAYNNKIIVMGQGDKGSLMYVREEDTLYDLQAIKVREIVNTVGAGDALFSAFLHYYIKGYEPIECLKRATIFAAYKIGANGASVGFADEQLVDSMIRQNVLQ